MQEKGEIIIYQNSDDHIKIDVRLEDETVWLSQEQMALLFGKVKSTINEHIKNVYSENELQESETMRKFGNSEFSTKPTNFYNLDVIILVGSGPSAGNPSPNWFIAGSLPRCPC